MPQWIGGPLEAALERGLDESALRHRLIASNVANLDTPGYRARRPSFAEALVRVQGAAPELGLVRTDPAHLGREGAAPRITLDETPRRADGNSVDPEREMRDLAANGITYAVLVHTLAMRYREMRAAIAEGR